MPVTSEPLESTGSTTSRFKADWVRDRMSKVNILRIEDLAIASGISRQQMHRILAGDYLPSAPTERKMAKALKCMIEDLHEDVPADGAL